MSLTDGVYASWNINGNALDELGVRDLTVTNASLVNGPYGVVNGGYDTQGEAYYLSATNMSFITPSGDYTVAGWVYWNGPVGDGRNTQSIWIGGSGVSDRNGFTVADKDYVYSSTNIVTGAVGYQSYNGSSYNGVRANTSYALPVGEWVHYACVSNSGVKTLYINGVSIGDSNHLYQINPSNVFRFSYISKNTSGYGSFNGIYGPHTVWSRPLTAAEVAEHGSYARGYPWATDWTFDYDNSIINVGTISPITSEPFVDDKSSYNNFKTTTSNAPTSWNDNIGILLMDDNGTLHDIGLNGELTINPISSAKYVLVNKSNTDFQVDMFDERGRPLITRFKYS